MAARSAGLLLCRGLPGRLEVLLVHLGGPYFARRDLGSWTVPKGLIEPGETPLAAGKREFVEETGFALPPGPYVELGEIRQKGGKRVSAWAVRGDADPSQLRSATFELEWPPRSGQRRRFPEVDRAAWFDRQQAERHILPAQLPLLARAHERSAAIFASGPGG